MRVSELKISQLVDLLGRSIADEKVVSALGSHLFQIDRKSFRSYISLPDEGLELVFDGPDQNAPVAAQAGAIRLSAIHVRKGGDRGAPGSYGGLPSGVLLGDTETEIRGKLGEPVSTGGGGFTSIPPIWPIPHWLKYWIGNAIFHFQLDDTGRVDMVTLMAEEPQAISQPPERLVIVIIPSLVSLLWRREKEKGLPLSEQEVLEIRDTAPAIALPLEGLAAVEERRGYRDVNPDNCWEEWQQMRLELVEYDQSRPRSD
jgi:hypothetical protein